MNRNHPIRTVALGLAALSSFALSGCNNSGGATRVNNGAASNPGATSTTAPEGRAVLNVGFLPVT